MAECDTEPEAPYPEGPESQADPRKPGRGSRPEMAWANWVMHDSGIDQSPHMRHAALPGGLKKLPSPCWTLGRLALENLRENDARLAAS